METGWLGPRLQDTSLLLDIYGTPTDQFLAELAAHLIRGAGGPLNAWNPLTGTPEQFLDVMTRYERTCSEGWAYYTQPPLRSSPRAFNATLRDETIRTAAEGSDELALRLRNAGKKHDSVVRGMHANRAKNPATLYSVLTEGAMLQLIARAGVFRRIGIELSQQFFAELRDQHEGNKYWVFFANGRGLSRESQTALRTLASITMFDGALSVRKPEGSIGLTFHQGATEIERDQRIMYDLKRNLTHDVTRSSVQAKIDDFLWLAERPQIIHEKAAQMRAASGTVDWFTLSLADLPLPRKSS